jgi:hypothetical protein
MGGLVRRWMGSCGLFCRQYFTTEKAGEPRMATEQASMALRAKRSSGAWETAGCLGLD